MSLKPIYVAIVFATVCLSLTAAQGGHNPQQPSGIPTELLMRDAARLIAAGDFGAAETFYNTILRRDPDNKQARLARGHVRAWQHKYDEAREDFLAILRLDPNNLSALNGLGYSFAWASAYDEAEKRFRQSLAVAPGQLEASKGLAYVALWRGDAKEAVRRFQALSAQAAHDAEIQVGLGQAYLAAGQRRNGHEAFERAQQIEPARKDAKEGREATRFRNPVVEVTVWGGNTQFQKNGTSDTGIRFAEVAILPTRNTRAWFQSDNGLSLDNLALVQANQEVHTYYVGGLLNWRQHYTTRLEAGWRELPGKISQRIVRGEQVFSLSRSHALRAGAWVGPREDGRTEWVANVGVIAPVREPFRLESTFFYSRSGLASERQWRLLLAGEYSLPKGWRMGGGLAGGKATTLAGGRNNLWDGFLSASAPLGQFGRARVLFRRETPGGGNAITVFAVGYSLYLPGR